MAQIHSDSPVPVIGIGGSAGGLEAVSELVGALPANTGMAFVVVLHLGAHQDSALVEILSRVAALPVNQAHDGLAVERNHIYVIAPNTNIELDRGALRVTPRVEGTGIHMPVDLLFKSLAAECGSTAGAVVLSGGGADGTMGLQAIKAEGGVTFAQDATARHDSMPRGAIATGCVDFVLPPSEIAREIQRLARHPYAAPPDQSKPSGVADNDFQEVLRLLQRSSKVDFTNYKRPTLQRRIDRRMFLRRYDNLRDYLTCLKSDSSELDMLCQEVLIHVTNFFRDPEVFDVLQQTAFPKLLENRASDQPIRIWVPGCSTGEEAYSLAICLLEYLRDRAASIPLKIFATDISETAISKARSGIYPGSIAADVSPQRLSQFFSVSNGGYQINKSVRDLCVFARHDVTHDPPFSQIDLVSCRNVLIYLGTVLQRRVFPILHYALRPGGYLLLGTTESVGGFADLFQSIDKKYKIFSRLAGPSRLAYDYPGATTASGMAPPTPGALAFQAAAQFSPKEADRILLDRYAPAGVVIDDDLQIVQFRGQTGPYLEPAAGTPTLDLLRMARPGMASDLRNTISRAKETGNAAHQSGVRVKTNEHVREIGIEVIPLRSPGRKSDHFLVLFEETASAVRPTPDPTPDPTPAAARAAALSSDVPAAAFKELQKEHNATKSYLQSVIEEHEASNEELRAAYEEIVSGNEELTTINDELQSRIQETSQLNSDLHNLIESTNIPILILGGDLRIRRFSPSAQRVLGLLPGDAGRQVGDLRFKVQMPDLPHWAAEVIGTLAIKQLEVSDNDGCWYSLMMRPYKTLDNRIDGVVLTLVDIDQLKRREQQLEDSRNYIASIVETVREPLLVLDNNLRVRDANRAFYELFALTPSETENCLVYTLAGGNFNLPQLRRLLEDILPSSSHFEDFEIRADFPHIGRKILILNAHRMVNQNDQASQLILLAVEDVTERMVAQEARESSEARLQAIVQTAAEGIITIDQQGTIESFNAAAEQMFGYVASEVVGKNVRLLMPSPERDRHDGYLANYLSSGIKTIIGNGREIIAERKNGTPFHAWIAVSEVAFDGQRLYTGMVRDITPEKLAIRQLQRSIAIVQRAEELAKLGNFEIHFPASAEDYWSEGVNRIMGLVLAPGKLTSENFFVERIHPEDRDRVRGELEKALAANAHFDLEYRIVRADGAIRNVRSVGESKRGNAQEAILLGTLHDITELKEAETRVLQSERLAAIGQVSTGLAHESRNALQRSQACLEMLASEVEGHERAMQLIARIQKAQDYLVDLYEEVRDYAAPLKLRPAKTDLNVLLHEVWDDLEVERAGKNAVLRVESDELDRQWTIDPLRMRQVFRNIIENSLAARPQDVEITVRLRTASVASGGLHLQIRLRDNGPGLTAQQRQNVFAPFFTTKTHGTGLGMAIAKRIVEAHGGQLELGSAKEPGAEFIITLPEQQP